MSLKNTIFQPYSKTPVPDFLHKLCECCDSQSKGKKKELEFFSRDGFEIFTEKSDFWICVLMESY